MNSYNRNYENLEEIAEQFEPLDEGFIDEDLIIVSNVMNGCRCTFAAPDCLEFVEGNYYPIEKLMNHPHIIDGDNLILKAVWVDTFGFCEFEKMIAMFDIGHFKV